MIYYWCIGVKIIYHLNFRENISTNCLWFLSRFSMKINFNDLSLIFSCIFSALWHNSHLFFIDISMIIYGNTVIDEDSMKVQQVWFFIKIELLATLGEGLGCVLIKSTLGFWGNPEGRDAGNNGEQWGTGRQFTSNLELKRTLASQQEGAK